MLNCRGVLVGLRTKFLIRKTWVMLMMTKQIIKSRVDNWIDRLDKLYGLLDTWRSEFPESKVLAHPCHRRPRSKWSSSMWVRWMSRLTHCYEASVGSHSFQVRFDRSANGRVNITTNRHQYALVDIAGKNGDGQRLANRCSGRTQAVAEIRSRNSFRKLMGES